MSVHLQREVEKLKRTVLSLCALVEDNVQLAVRAFEERDVDLANEVERRDKEVDEREVDVEEECLKILALYQPVAIDLRFVVSTLKINNDLERIGDLAVNVAHKAAILAGSAPLDVPVDVPGMAAKTQTMLRDSLNAFVNMDAALAYNVCAMDDEVDDAKRAMREFAEKAMADHSAQVAQYNTMMGLTRNLERIADLATNICEDVIYMIEGKIVRHTDEQ